jgi:hypothetical protein
MRFVLGFVVMFASGCPAAFECGGLSKDPPTDVSTGKGFATRSDGATLNGAASWSSGSLGSVDVASLDMGIAKDVTGSDLDTLVSDGAFPICISLGAPGTNSQAANLLESPSLESDATHTGNLALVKLNGNELLGRFQVNMTAANGAKTVNITNGEFSATRRQ